MLPDVRSCLRDFVVKNLGPFLQRTFRSAPFTGRALPLRIPCGLALQRYCQPLLAKHFSNASHSKSPGILKPSSGLPASGARSDVEI
jgi:hypothetical protein